MTVKQLKLKSVIIFLIAVFFITSGAICGGPKETDTLKLGSPKSVVINYWGPWNDSASLNPLIAVYQQMHPHIQIKYTKVNANTFENDLLNAFAEDRGPDIFTIHNTWLRKYLTKITPMPATTTMAYNIIKGTLKKESWTEYKTSNSMSMRFFQDNYLEAVTNDVIINNGIYALPLSIDTMALFYNKDLLNNAGFTAPPKNWKEFQEQVIALTTQDRKGNIIQAGAAIGTADNIERSTDLLALLMMQNGTVLADANGYAKFSSLPEELRGRTVLPSVEALNFYTDFASPTKQVYTWNNQMNNSLNAFTSGKVAFFFGYSYHLPVIRAQAPKLNFTVTTMPQISENKSVNYANYWLEVVSKKTSKGNEAWDFLQFITNPQNVKTYLNTAKKPTAVKSLIDGQLEDIDLAPFASQLLTTKTWYKGIAPETAESIFKEMINLNNAGELETKKIIELGASKINQTIK